MKIRSSALAALCLAAAACLIQGKQSSQAKQSTNLSLGVFEAHEDIGANPKSGNSEYDAGAKEYHITGGGANIWGTEDAFQFAYVKLSGDITVFADVKFLGAGVEQHRKAALMIRQSLDPGAAYADVALHGDGLTSLQYRETPGAETKELRSDLKAPGRIKIERRGNQFTMSAGNPAEELKMTGPVTVNLQDPVYVGLAVSSHNPNVVETAVFSNFTLQRATLPKQQSSISGPFRH